MGLNRSTTLVRTCLPICYLPVTSTSLRIDKCQGDAACQRHASLSLPFSWWVISNGAMGTLTCSWALDVRSCMRSPIITYCKQPRQTQEPHPQITRETETLHFRIQTLDNAYDTNDRGVGRAHYTVRPQTRESMDWPLRGLQDPCVRGTVENGVKAIPRPIPQANSPGRFPRPDP